VNFDSYSAADQARIAKRMLAVLEAGAAEVDLEAGAPLAVGDAEGAEAQRRIAALIAPGAGG
ncbi:MAG: hypothetical protein SGI73_07300, partial [Chloroflexota bacterium]|nr:hypothetical protein [Chloroflexota bacterium]